MVTFTLLPIVWSEEFLCCNSLRILGVIVFNLLGINIAISDAHNKIALDLNHSFLFFAILAMMNIPIYIQSYFIFRYVSDYEIMKV